MEPKVILLSPSEGGKLVISLHNMQYITLVPHKSLMHHDSQKKSFIVMIFIYYFQYVTESILKIFHFWGSYKFPFDLLSSI